MIKGMYLRIGRGSREEREGKVFVAGSIWESGGAGNEIWEKFRYEGEREWKELFTR